MNLELSPLFVHNLLFIVKIYFDFQVYMFSNDRGMTKSPSFFIDDDNENYDAKAIAIPWVFFENSQAKKMPFLNDK